MFPDLRYLLPIVLAGLALACSSKGDASNESSRASGGSGTADAAVSIATLVPEPTLAPPTPTSTATQTPQPTATPLPPTATPVPPAPTETPTPTATSTPTQTPTPTLTPTPTITPTPIIVSGIVLSTREQQLFAFHNQLRVGQGLAPLSLDPALMAIARERARIMAENLLFSHYAPNGDTVFDLLAEADYAYGDATENIHYNNVAESSSVSFAMGEFQKSPPHRANIVDPGFHRIGIGIQTNLGVHYISIVFTD